MNKLLLGTLTAALCACGGSGTKNDAGQDAGEQPVVFTVTGRVTTYPPARPFLADAGMSDFPVAGLLARVEEPLKVALGQAAGIFGQTVLSDAGTISVSGISSDEVSLGVGIGVLDPSDAGAPRVIRAATGVWDVALEASKPRGDILNQVAYAVPTGFHDLLTEAIGRSTIAGITSVGSKNTLIKAGFLLGRIVDAQGKPVAGATIKSTPSSYDAQFFYPKADYSGVQAQTDSNGMFVFVHNGGTVQPFRFDVTGRPEYRQRNAGAAADACLVLTVYPGTTAPPAE